MAPPHARRGPGGPPPPRRRPQPRLLLLLHCLPCCCGALLSRHHEAAPHPLPRRRHLEERPICLDGRAVPRLYLLGHAKCGTTSIAGDLQAAGAAFFAAASDPDSVGPAAGLSRESSWGKESHVLMEICGFPWGWSPQRRVAGCPPPSPEVRRWWLGNITRRSCSHPQGTLLDATPANARLPGLPALLRGLYGREAGRLGLVVVLREPLTRLQSNWHFVKWAQFQGGDNGVLEMRSFKDYLDVQEAGIEKYRAIGYQGMELDKSVDWVYRSLYSLSLAPWLTTFRSGQMVVVPMAHYFNSTESRSSLVRLLSSQFGATMTADNLGEEVHQLRNAHPRIEEEVDSKTLERWWGNYFRPDLQRLAGLISEVLPSRLHLLGYSGVASAPDVFSYLCQALPCLL